MKAILSRSAVGASSGRLIWRKTFGDGMAVCGRCLHTTPAVFETSRKTHFGFRDVAEDDKEGLVGGVFSSVASKYDVMNDAMSLGVHRLWKDHFVKKLDPRGGIECLDVAGGTGDIALRILDHARLQHHDRKTRVKILDINPSMLRAGQRRMKTTMYWGGPQVQFALGNAEKLGESMPLPDVPTARASEGEPLPQLLSEPVPSNSVDLYTIAFGIRNCTHIEEVLKEAHRVLKPGGIFACLEFGKVSVPLFAEAYRAYSFNLIPSLGHILAGDRDSYQYLIESIERFPTQPQFARMIRNAGFTLPGTSEAIAAGLPPMEAGVSLPFEVPDALKRFTGGSAPPAADSFDVLGAWEDVSFGIASIWTGYVAVNHAVSRGDLSLTRPLSHPLPFLSLHITSPTIYSLPCSLF